MPRRVRSAHHVNNLTLTRESLSSAAAIVNSCTLQPVDPRSIQPPPLHPGRDHERVTRYLVSVRQLDDSVRPFDADANHFLRRQDLHSETLGLHHGPPRQIGTTESGRKSEIVLDAGAHTGLTAW